MSDDSDATESAQDNFENLHDGLKYKDNSGLYEFYTDVEGTDKLIYTFNPSNSEFIKKDNSYSGTIILISPLGSVCSCPADIASDSLWLEGKGGWTVSGIDCTVIVKCLGPVTIEKSANVILYADNASDVFIKSGNKKIAIRQMPDSIGKWEVEVKHERSKGKIVFYDGESGTSPTKAFKSGIFSAPRKLTELYTEPDRISDLENVLKNSNYLHKMDNGFKKKISVGMDIAPGEFFVDSEGNCFFGKKIIDTDTLLIPKDAVKLQDGIFEDCIVGGNTGITLPDGLKTIGKSAFKGCTGLTSVVIPEGVASIDEKAFYGCTGLTSITVPSTANAICSNAFYGCIGLETVALSDGIKIIGDNAFGNCSGISSITIPNSITQMGFGVFSNCSELVVSFEFGGNDIITLGRECFAGCKNTDMVFPARLGNIPMNLFGGKNNLTSIDFEKSDNPDGVKYSLTEADFKGLEQLANLKFPVMSLSKWPQNWVPEGCLVEYIGDPGEKVKTECGVNYFVSEDSGRVLCSVMNAIEGYNGNVKLPQGVNELVSPGFKNWVDLKDVQIPESLTVLGDNSFQGCSELSNVTFEGTSKLETIGKWAFEQTAIDSIEIPSSVSKIDTYSFDGSLLSSVKFLGTGSVDVYDGAFEYCSNLTTIDTGSTKLNFIGGMIFQGCGKIYEFDLCTISNTKLPDNTFNNSGLKTLTIPDSITDIGMNNLPKTLKTIVVSENHSSYCLDKNGAFYQKSGDGLVLLFVPLSVTTLKLGSDVVGWSAGPLSYTNVTSVILIEGFELDIPQNAFSGCSLLNKFDASTSSLKKIGDNAFARSSIVTVELPKTITSIGSGTFKECANLEKIDLSGIKLTLGENAFVGCSSLREVKIPASVVDERSHLDLFDGCNRLRSLEITDLGEQSKTYSSEDHKLVLKKEAQDVKLIYVVPVLESTKLTIPDDVTYISPQAVCNTYFDELEISDNNKNYTVHEGAIYNKEKTTLEVVPSKLKVLNLPATIEKVPRNILELGSSLTDMHLVSGTGDILFEHINRTSLEFVALETSGSITFTSGFGMSINLESLSIDCSSLSTSGNRLVDNTDYGLVLKLNESGNFDGKFDCNLSSLTLDWRGHDGLKGFFKENKSYSIDNITINGIQKTADDVILGTKLTTSSDSIDGLDLYIDTVFTGFDKEPAYILADVSGKWMTINDIDVEGGTVINGKIKVVVSQPAAEIQIKITEKSGNSIEITLNYHNGADNGTFSVIEGRTINIDAIEVPVRSGYTFKGWYTDAEVSNIYSGSPADSSTILHARWSLNEGVSVSFDDSFGLVEARYVVDKRMFYNGENVSPQDELVFLFKDGNGVEFIDWTINEKNGVTTKCSEKSFKDTFDNDVQIVPSIRIYSDSNSLINTTPLPTPEWTDVHIQWENKFKIDTSMSTWTGFPSIPVLVDDCVFVRANDDLMKIDMNSGEILKKVTTEGTTAHAYYHYLGYGDGVIFDYMTGNAYDLDLEPLYSKTINGEKITAVFHDSGYFYGLSDGKLWKFNSKTGEDVNTGSWSGGVEVKWHGIYGTTSTPVFNDGWVFFIEVDEEKRMIGAINLEDGHKEQITISRISNYLIDDGWLTHYKWDNSRGGDDGDYFFITAYKKGLFDSGSETSKVCCVKFADGKFEDTGKWLELKSPSTASAFVVVDGRGYVNISGDDNVIGTKQATMYVVDVDKFLETSVDCWTYAGKDPQRFTNFIYGCKEDSGQFSDYGYIDEGGNKVGKFIIYADESINTHGSIVVSTSYIKTTGSLYIYLLPYQASEQAVYIFEDHIGKTEPTGYLKTSPVGENFGSQAVRVGPEGQLIWYTDSGSLWCVKSIKDMPYSFFIQDGDNAMWHQAIGSTVYDAIGTLDSSVITLTEGKSLESVNGKSAEGWHIMMLKDGSWVEINNLVDSSYRNNYNYIITNVTMPADGTVFSYAGPDSILTYQFDGKAVDKEIVGKQLVLGTENIVTIRFMDDKNTQIDDSVIIGIAGSDVVGSLPELYKPNYICTWTLDGKTVTSLPDKMPGKNAVYKLVWKEVECTYGIDCTATKDLTKYNMDVTLTRTSGTNDIVGAYLFVSAKYTDKKFIQSYIPITNLVDGKCTITTSVGIENLDNVAFAVVKTMSIADGNYGQKFIELV